MWLLRCVLFAGCRDAIPTYRRFCRGTDPAKERKSGYYLELRTGNLTSC